GAARTFDVGVALGLLVRAQVVDGGQVEEVVDAPGEVVTVTLGNAQQLVGQVAANGYEASGIHAQTLAHGVELVFGTGTHQRENLVVIVAGKQTGNDKTANEAGGASDEVFHVLTPVMIGPWWIGKNGCACLWPVFIFCVCRCG